MSTTKIKEDTGEIINDNSCYREEIMFNSVFYKPTNLVDQDLSRETEEIFEEVAPYAVDVATGKLLNETSVPKIISKGFINVHEKIQTFAKECDIYSILEKYAASGDITLLSAREAGYGDLSDLPTNLNDFAQYVGSNFKVLDELNPDLAKMVIDGKSTPEEIQAKANEIYQARLKEYNEKNKIEEVKE